VLTLTLAATTTSARRSPRPHHMPSPSLSHAISPSSSHALAGLHLACLHPPCQSYRDAHAHGTCTTSPSPAVTTRHTPWQSCVIGLSHLVSSLSLSRHAHPPAILVLVRKREQARTTSRRTQVCRHHLPVMFDLDSPPRPRATLTLLSHFHPIPSRLSSYQARTHGRTCMGYGYGYNSSIVSHV
jgi:hypothetical protein